MSIEVGPPKYTQQELGGMQKQLEENQKKNAGAESFAFGLIFIAVVGLALCQAFPNFFGAVFWLINFAFTLAIWAAIIYAGYRIYKFFTKKNSVE